jgi:DNA-binding response OmpR family regulator
MSVRVLLVEDDDRVRTVLSLALQDEGYEVSPMASAEEALGSFASVDPDVMLVDLMLGGMSGFDCIREVRRSSDIPIVVVSARDDTHDIVAGLEVGADDYLTKPFQVKEMTARLRALLRRSQRRPEAPAEDVPALVLDGSDPAAPLQLSTAAGWVRRGDDPVHLTLTEFRLLGELADADGRVLSRQQLLERVWDHGFFGDERLVDVHVRRLRTKIEVDPANPELIVTVRGLGYRLDRR